MSQNTLFPVEQCRIRRATPDDFSGLWALEKAAHRHPWAEDILKSFLSASGVRLWLVEPLVQDGIVSQPLAFAALQSVVDEASLLNMVVAPQHQGRGLGRYLLNRLIDIVVEEGVAQSVFLEVRVSNHSAIRLYASCGFVEIGQRAEYYLLSEGRREDALMMALPLQISFD